MYRVLFIIVILFSTNCYSQIEGSNWYFAFQAGINFDPCTDEVNALIDGQVSNQAGSASISDSQGNLLFYTDGVTVWDKNHNPMPNADENAGNPLLGKGDAIILPDVSNDNRYYIFTVDNASFWNIPAFLPNNLDDNVNEGLTYSVVDMSLNNGLGDIVVAEKNKHLITYSETDPVEVAYKCAEKLTAVRGSDCNSYWIITHFLASFYAFKLDSNGVDPNPVVSTVPPLVPINDDIDYAFNAIGNIKASPDGKQIAITHNSFSDEDEFYEPGGVYLYDFDNSTGAISNAETLYFNQGRDYPFGVEFSASGSWLYATVSDRILDDDNQSKILRWNLQASNIANSIEIIKESDEIDYSGLQLADDGLIYVSQALFLDPIPQDSFLGIIYNNDSIFPQVNYDEFGLLLDINNTGSIGSYRLPQFNKQWFNTRIDIINNGINSCELFLCGSQNEILTAENIIGADYIWSKDGAIINSETSNELEISEPGFYEVFIEPNDGRCPIYGFATALLSDDVPIAVDTSIFQCDEDGISDGITTFNLNQLTNIVSNNEPNRLVEFYESFFDAQSQTDSIDGSNYNNSSNPQTVYALVINTDSGCSSISEVILEVSTTGVANTSLIGCDEDGVLDGIGNFNLNNAASTILQGLQEDLSIAFYGTYEDALLENNALPNSYTNTTPFNEIIYARVEDGFNCYGISEIELTVLIPPNIEPDSDIQYCLNEFPDPITLLAGVVDDNPSNYFYEWSTGESTSEIDVNEPGIYTVTVTNTSGCSSSRTITVFSSNIATINTISVTDGSSNNSITLQVSGEGDYEFALDNINGPYQDSPVFEDVSFGFHEVFVRDKNGCGIVSEIVSVIGFPKFFTPNDDTVNDFWQVKGISSQFQPNSKILIFDRYGKLLIALDPLGSGWDGTYNGLPLPSSDYWFMVTLQDGRTFNGHFALRR